MGGEMKDVPIQFFGMTKKMNLAVLEGLPFGLVVGVLALTRMRYVTMAGVQRRSRMKAEIK